MNPWWPPSRRNADLQLRKPMANMARIDLDQFDAGTPDLETKNKMGFRLAEPEVCHSNSADRR